MKGVLKRFICERVLFDNNLKIVYTKGKCTTPSGKFEVMYQDEMGEIRITNQQSTTSLQEHI